MKKFYIKKAEKHRIWVKWEELFKDEIAQEDGGLKGQSRVILIINAFSLESIISF